MHRIRRARAARPMRRPMRWASRRPAAARAGREIARTASSCGRLEGPWTLRRCAPLRRALLARLAQRAAHALRIEVAGVDGSAGLLSPRFVESPGVDGIETDLVDELHNDS